MSKADRVSIDITGLREQIENYQQDLLWQELTLSKKIRVLIQEGLAARSHKQTQEKKDTTLQEDQQ